MGTSARRAPWSVRNPAALSAVRWVAIAAVLWVIVVCVGASTKTLSEPEARAAAQRLLRRVASATSDLGQCWVSEERPTTGRCPEFRTMIPPGCDPTTGDRCTCQLTDVDRCREATFRTNHARWVLALARAGAPKTEPKDECKSAPPPPAPACPEGRSGFLGECVPEPMAATLWARQEFGRSLGGERVVRAQSLLGWSVSSTCDPKALDPNEFQLALSDELRRVRGLGTSDLGEAPPEATRVIQNDQDPLRIAGAALGSPFGERFMRTGLLLTVVILGVVSLLYALMFLRLERPLFASVLLMACSLPPFAVCYFAQNGLGYQVIRYEEATISAHLQMILVMVAAGGITFDVGRRALALVDEFRVAPPIRGLEFFGASNERAGFAAAAQRMVAHFRYGLSDTLGRRERGLESARHIDHFIVRMVEFRILEYLSSRGAFVVDNLLIIGIMYGIPTLATNAFTDMIVRESPVEMVRGATSVLLYSLAIRLLALTVHNRLFPRRHS